MIKIAIEAALKAATMGMNFWQPNIPDFEELHDPGLRDRLLDKYLGGWKAGDKLRLSETQIFRKKLVSIFLLNHSHIELEGK